MHLLVDTSVWVDHLRSGDQKLAAQLQNGHVLMHTMVIGELACGSLRKRNEILFSLHQLPRLKPASDSEVLPYIESKSLWGKGLGFIDFHLLVAVGKHQTAKFWTRDKRLHAVASNLGLAFDETP